MAVERAVATGRSAADGGLRLCSDFNVKFVAGPEVRDGVPSLDTVSPEAYMQVFTETPTGQKIEVTVSRRSSDWLWAVAAAGLFAFWLLT